MGIINAANKSIELPSQPLRGAIKYQNDASRAKQNPILLMNIKIEDRFGSQITNTPPIIPVKDISNIINGTITITKGTIVPISPARCNSAINQPKKIAIPKHKTPPNIPRIIAANLIMNPPSLGVTNCLIIV